MHSSSSPLSAIEELRAIVARLRAPGGCPWDREQTHATLRGGLLEEAYEVVAAIDSADDANLREELGDLLLQVVFHSQIAEEEGRFMFDEVAAEITTKLVRRHPHVFGEESLDDSGAVLKRWDEIKRAEKAASGTLVESALDGVPAGLPALMHAEKVQKKAGKIGFDWDAAAPVLAKVREELAEVEHAMASGDQDEIEKEIGDLLFAAVNLARKLKVEPEVALRRATEKFAARFRAVEQLGRERSLKLEDMSLAELDLLWEEVKRAAPGA
ncbi:MAG: nucleoside triphosphate pyrophosphohydrolase [Chthoniobacteraceae bacterium]